MTKKRWDVPYLLILIAVLVLLYVVMWRHTTVNAAEPVVAPVVLPAAEVVPEIPEETESAEGPAPDAIWVSEGVVAPPEQGIETAEQHPDLRPPINEEDLYWLTHVLTGECHTYSWEHQVAVGSVVLNRVADPNYPDTIQGVIKDRKHGIQYACYWDGNFQREPTARNWAVAEYLLTNGSQAPANVIYQSQKRQGSGVWKKIDKTFFCFR